MTMLEKYNPGEILKIAVEVEKNGKELYALLEVKSRDPQASSLWAYLKQQEEIHQQTFQEILSNQKDYLVVEFSAGEHEPYLKAIASEYIFTQDLIKEYISQEFKSDSEAIDFGISVEKISILTYAALREYINKDKQPVLDKIIDEEKNHLAKLKSLKRTIDYTGI